MGICIRKRIKEDKDTFILTKIYRPNEDSIFTSKEIKKIYYNILNSPTIFGLFYCCNGKEPILLTPDDFWSLIVGYIHNYINFIKKNKLNFEILRNNQTTSPLHIYHNNITNDNYDRSQHIKKVEKDNLQYSLYAILQANFSTTNKNERDITNIGKTNKEYNFDSKIQNIYNNYSDNNFLPSITLKGTIEDYNIIVNKLELIQAYGLNKWCNNLKEIFLKIIETKNYLNMGKKKDIDYDFWGNMIISYDSKYRKIESKLGWISAFFIDDYNEKGNNINNTYNYSDEQESINIISKNIYHIMKSGGIY